MGITISRTVHDPIDPSVPIAKSKSPLKFHKFQLKAFNGRTTEFTNWRLHTECAFTAAGCEQILMDADYGRNHPLKNALVYFQLSLALIDGHAFHLVENHAQTRDGHRAWQDIITWYHSSKRNYEVPRREIYIEDRIRPPEVPEYTPVTPSPGRAKKRRIRMDTTAHSKYTLNPLSGHNDG
jgi:hypothetical protein